MPNLARKTSVGLSKVGEAMTFPTEPINHQEPTNRPTQGFTLVALLVVYFLMAKGKHDRAGQVVGPGAPDASAETRAEAKTLYESASVKLSQGDHEGAIPLLNKAVDLNPRLAEAHKDLAHALVATGREGPAIEEMSKYLVEAPDDLGAQRERTRC